MGAAAGLAPHWNPDLAGATVERSAMRAAGDSEGSRAPALGPRARAAAVALSAGALAACAAKPPAPREAGRGAGAPSAALLGPARYFQSTPDEAYWVAHADDLDRVVAAGARLELGPTGEVRAAAWDVPDGRGEPLLGSLAIAPHLGGGFLHFTASRAFRSTEFTGPLAPVALWRATRSPLTVRGARNGLASVLVATDAGPLALAPGASQASPVPEPGLFDLAALDARRAVRLDAFGRAATTVDGGASWRDATPTAGVAVRSLFVTDGELGLDTYQSRLVLGDGGRLREPDVVVRSSTEYGKAFQTFLRGARTAEREGWPWAFRETSPLGAAVLSGAALPGGAGLALIQGALARVDLTTAEARWLSTDGLPPSLQCQPLRADDGVLLACAWDRFEGYGAYVLRWTEAGGPELERALTDDGYFVADDEGALGYVGSCSAEPRFVDPSDPSRFDPAGDAKPARFFCVRRGPGDWAEREVDADLAPSLHAWIPRKDGGAVALLLGPEGDGGSLPDRAGEDRVVERGSVRLVRLRREIDGWFWGRPGPRTSGRGPSPPIVRTFRARPDGSVDGWLASSADGDEGRFAAGVTLGREGRPVVHDLPPELAGMVVTGDFGVAIGRSGRLYETVDHGRSWRGAGLSPVPPAAFSGGCSALGCALGGVVRVGWGTAESDAPRVRAATGPLPETPAAGADVPRLACTPVGAPAPLAGPPPPPPGGRTSIATPYGDAIDLVREAGAPEPPATAPAVPVAPASASLGPKGKPPRPALGSGAAAPGKGRARSARAPRTQALVYRPPFEPDATARRLDASDASLGGQRRVQATPLLGERGDVSLLLVGDGQELLVSPEDVASFRPFETRRYLTGDRQGWSGLRTGARRALVLGDVRRRTALEEHGDASLPPPLFVGLERDTLQKRQLTLARRDDGAAGVLVLDGAAPETAGVAELDRLVGLGPRGAEGAPPSLVTRLAPWSTLTAADDPRCNAERGGWRAIVLLDPAAWLDLDPAALPGVALGGQGMARVVWGRERVCLEAIDFVVTDTRRRLEAGAQAALVVRWAGGSGEIKAAGRGALRWPDLAQGLACRVGPAPRREAAP